MMKKLTTSDTVSVEVTAVFEGIEDFLQLLFSGELFIGDLGRLVLFQDLCSGKSFLHF